ncbi:MAG: hypothetical protein ACD_24C00319G0003 [uncultured bacterium]|uniref:phosphoglycerate mutase (2,3-diphosphoglycerate-dependent) n=1 Tax=candidate division WWE3 bacterium RBG_16_37_10 TaxID=1802610 RepID=A0A1F4V087_UNCKA|nr:MAG: hypothetical protein ACD_24C00319G0003 [uncultured bacterium]OGC50614.1 MAG: hypothetical protein A2W32_04865 [candidate division WWE3 bacterium RBG_16_37_10]
MVEPALYKKYPKQKIEEALALLNYKKVSDMPKKESNTRPTIYIFRHGQTEDNANFIFSGWRDSLLTEKGREQALELAKILKDKKLDVLISSPQSRAVETMKLAVSLNEYAKDREISMDNRIKERGYGELQGKSKLEIQLENPELLKKYRRSYLEKAERGESLEDVVKRVEDFCKEIVPLMKLHKLNVAVSCHGNSIRGFRKYFENLTPEQVCEVETPLGQDYISYVID